MSVGLFICSYSDIIIEREVLMQKYIHLVQIVETEKVAANQLRTQLEDQDTEIERLKAEVRHACTPPPPTHTRNHEFHHKTLFITFIVSTFSEIATFLLESPLQCVMCYTFMCYKFHKRDAKAGAS